MVCIGCRSLFCFCPEMRGVRAAAFRLQFVQRYLTGPPDLVWSDVAIFSCVNNLGPDAALFLTNLKILK